MAPLESVDRRPLSCYLYGTCVSIAEWRVVIGQAEEGGVDVGGLVVHGPTRAGVPKIRE